MPMTKLGWGAEWQVSRGLKENQPSIILKYSGIGTISLSKFPKIVRQPPTIPHSGYGLKMTVERI